MLQKNDALNALVLRISNLSAVIADMNTRMRKLHLSELY